MSEAQRNIRLYYLPQSFPCGPQSSCCGPVGQSDEMLRDYVVQLESAVPGAQVETIDVSRKLDLARHRPVVRLLNTFGPAACPVFALGDEVISMGPPAMAELVELIKTKLGAPEESLEQTPQAR